MRRGKQQMTEGIELPDQEKIRKGNFRVFGLIGSGHYQTSDDERKNRNRVSRVNEKTFRNQAL